MAVLNSNRLKAQARESVACAPGMATRLVLIYTGVTVALSLGANGLNLYLNEQIGTTGGLSGMGLRSVLQTIQTLLHYFTTLFTPFWQAGFLFSMISLARRQDPQPGNLFRGFQRFGSILSNTIWQMFLLMMLGFALAYVSSFLFLMTPFGVRFTELLMPLMESGALLMEDGSINLEAMAMGELLPSLIPMVVIYGLLLIPAYLFLGYQLRMTTFLLVEGPRRSAFTTLLVSMKMMKGHKFQMLKLDLSFWWYYALELLLGVVLYLDLILPALGIHLPVNETVAYFLTLGLYGVLEIALHVWKKPYVDTTYAHAYDEIYQEFAAQYLQK